MRTGGLDCSDQFWFENLAGKAKMWRYQGVLRAAIQSVLWVWRAICLKYSIAKILAGLTVLFYEYWYFAGKSSLQTPPPGLR
jgi:hypothetical protein